MLYIIGCVQKSKVQQVFFIYGDVWFENFKYVETREEIINCIQKLLENKGFKHTSAKGSLSIKDIDNNGTQLRLRDFWDVQNPNSIFKQYKEKSLVVALSEDKFQEWEPYHKQIADCGMQFEINDHGVLLWK